MSPEFVRSPTSKCIADRAVRALKAPMPELHVAIRFSDESFGAFSDPVHVLASAILLLAHGHLNEDARDEAERLDGADRPTNEGRSACLIVKGDLLHEHTLLTHRGLLQPSP